MCHENGTIRIVPESNRWAEAIPGLDQEPAWMRECEVHCPKGTAIVKDCRIWHGGCQNTANPAEHPELGVGAMHARPMPNAQYNAPWFHRPGDNFRHLGHAQYTALSERGRRLARRVALPPDVEQPHYLAHAHSQIVPAEGGERDTSWREFLKLSGQVDVE